MIASSRWDLLDLVKYRDEGEAVAALLATEPLAPAARAAVQQEAIRLVQRTRQMTRRQGLVESFLQEFSLSTPEGLALMGLAEALLRTPDANTRDRLIAEKIAAADWASHLGQSDNLFVNASTWGLMLTGRMVDTGELTEPENIIRILAARAGEPVVRAAVAQALRIMSEQFVMGPTISDAIARARREKLRCSFDMLGEGARTEADAIRYEAAYAEAISAIGKSTAGPENGHGISVKLSALSPRYEATQETRVWRELYPRLKRLAQLAAEADLNFTLDAEEADRLVPSLKLLDRLAREPSLGSWRGLGLAVQAYQKRASDLVEALISLARETNRRLMVRLVKGAYWDSEVKRAQAAGRPGYPVFTTKSATDVSYLVCAEQLINASQYLYPQFATHNAHTLAAIKEMAGPAEIEFQRLHGMGEALYRAALDRYGSIGLRTYAPVGAYADLLPYLMRRLLENGANTSFMHQLLDKEISAEEVAADPICRAEACPGAHPRIPLPRNIYGDRKNSAGMDLSISQERTELAEALARQSAFDGRPIVDGISAADGPLTAVKNPYDLSDVGQSAEASKKQIDRAFAVAARAQAGWDERGGASRASILRAMADSLEENRKPLTALAIWEAGKTWADAIAEVREAADFCRYYALLAEQTYSEPAILRGPVGETNSLELHGRGVFACISPWNFPLAIFTGQIAAALAAGNTVVAKPAEQTPLIAAEAVRIFLGAGLPANTLHLLPGRGESVGAALTAHPMLAGIAFTGGTDTARAINQTLASRSGAIVPFVAETGGLNAMFVDTTAQREQLIDNVLLSAFGSAGQRCSALRILFLPEETAKDVMESLAGAMDVLTVGDPSDCATDVGPIIDWGAKSLLDRHTANLSRNAKIIRAVKPNSSGPLLFPPVMAEIELTQLPDREVFGPVLHVVRYQSDELERVGRALAGTGYGLTLGIHSRLESFARKVRTLVPAGNTYVNRSMIGAVVGVQPFGGEGLSGTGPKAGGPHALGRYSVERAVSVNIAALGGDPALMNMSN